MPAWSISARSRRALGILPGQLVHLGAEGADVLPESGQYLAAVLAALGAALGSGSASASAPYRSSSASVTGVSRAILSASASRSAWTRAVCSALSVPRRPGPSAASGAVRPRPRLPRRP